MPLFKIWNSYRSVKKFVIADTLDELKEKCLHKIGFPCEPKSLRIVLESDGTEVDDTEILHILQKETLIILADYETWLEPSLEKNSHEGNRMPIISAVQSLEPKPDELFNSGYLPLKTTLTLCEQSSSDHRNSPGSDSGSLKHSPVDDEVRNSIYYPPVVIARRTPLPAFSNQVMMHLNREECTQVWNKLIDECARFYLQIWPAISRRTEYQAIGEEIISEYPCLSHEGRAPWSYFTNCLSRRIRHLRWAEKNKGQPIVRNWP